MGVSDPLIDMGVSDPLTVSVLERDLVFLDALTVSVCWK